MSVKIEILDYKYSKGNLVTWDNDATTGWNTGTGITADATVSNGVLISSAGTGTDAHAGFDSYNLALNNNHSYTFKYTCVSLDNAGETDSQVFIKGVGSGLNNYRPFGSKNITVGTHSYTFTMDTSQNNDEETMDVYFQLNQGNNASKNIKIKNVSLVDNTVLNNIEWDESVVGELDVTDHTDFPLAMTFQISDVKDLTSTSGDYSKTFKIPATKNNNQLLKNPYISNAIRANDVTENKKCRISVNDIQFVIGFIRITGVGGYGETPSYYNCIFYGSNLNWADDLSYKYMDEIDWGGGGVGLGYNKTNIMATWQHEDCDDITVSDPPIVYPITSYGNYNPDGEPKTIQLLDTHYDWYTSIGGSTSSSTVGYYGYNNGGNFYNTPEPSSDWRPAVFVKNTLEKIFKQAGDGYTISSSFMDTDMFKKLVWLLPNFKYNNPDERYKDYSIESNFKNGESLSQDVEYNSVTYTINEDGVFRANYGGTVTYNDDNTTGGTPNYIGEPTASGGGTKLIPLNSTRLNVTIDADSYVDTTNDYITIGEYGYYKIELNGVQVMLANGQKGGGDWEYIYEIKVCVNLDVLTAGQSGDWHTISRAEGIQIPHKYISTSGTSTATNGTQSLVTDWGNLSNIKIDRCWLNKGDKIRLTAGLKITDTSENGQNFTMVSFIRSSDSSNFDISLIADEVSYGQTYDLDKVMNKSYKQVDFVKGIAHAFNLQMTTDETARVVNIEPFNAFYKDYADAIDWTYKLDRSNQTEDKWLKSDIKRDVVFKYKTDGEDKKVEARGEEYFDGVKDEYPYRETLPKTFEKGESKYENPFFAGTYNGKDQDTTGTSAGSSVVADTAFSGLLWRGNTWTTNLNRPEKGYDFLPRLLYWNKYSPASSAVGKNAKVQTWASVNKYIVADSSVTVTAGILSTIYPQATSINRDDSSSPILSYGNVNVRDFNDATGVYTSYASGKGLFETYYKNMFEMLKAKPRTRTVYIDLKVRDIINLDFQKLVYIDGVYWRINKIIDYQPNKNQSTKVELVEWLQLGAFAATSPAFEYQGGSSVWAGINVPGTDMEDDIWGVG